MGPIKISMIRARLRPLWASLIWFRLLAAGAIGFLAWRGQFWAIPLSLIAPCLIAVQPSRILAGSTALAYYSTASLPVIAVSEVYWPANGVLAIALWFAAAVVLSLLWVVFWTRQPALRPFAATAAVLLSGVPPLCIVGWASPLVSAGVLYPGSAWFGIAAVAALPGLLIHRATRMVGLLAATTTSIILNAGSKPINVPKGWEAEMTHIHRSPQQASLTDFFIQDRLQRIVMQSQPAFSFSPKARFATGLKQRTRFGLRPSMAPQKLCWSARARRSPARRNTTTRSSSWGRSPVKPYINESRFPAECGTRSGPREPLR
jgi:hypothetical protein